MQNPENCNTGGRLAECQKDPDVCTPGPAHIVKRQCTGFCRRLSPVMPVAKHIDRSEGAEFDRDNDQIGQRRCSSNPRLGLSCRYLAKNSGRSELPETERTFSNSGRFSLTKPGTSNVSAFIRSVIHVCVGLRGIGLTVRMIHTQFFECANLRKELTGLSQSAPRVQDCKAATRSI